MHPVIYSGDFQWNVDCSVGQNGQNSRPDDVSYVQWYYKRAGSFDAVDPQRRAIYAAVAVTGKCTGRPDDPLCRAILAHQIHLNHPEKDGRVSVATGAGKVGASAYFVYRLGARLADMHKREWPRLDLMPDCPAVVAAAVKEALPAM